MLARYVLADLWRNQRRTLSTTIGVILGVGLFCGVLFFVDGLSASMTQRAVEPLAIDMQRIVTERAAGTLTITATVTDPGTLQSGDQARVDLEIHNPGELPANEVTIRSRPGPDLSYVAGSAELDGTPISGFDDNPFASGPAQTGYNLGTLDAGATHQLSYLVQATATTGLTDASVTTTYSSRESVNPMTANQPRPRTLDELTRKISEVAGVAHASELSIADLGVGALSTESTTAPGPAKIFGFDEDYAHDDGTITIVDGSLTADGAVLSAEAARTLRVSVGDHVLVALPDGSSADFRGQGHRRPLQSAIPVLEPPRR